ncbi:flagellar motor switch protein FliN [Acuticoccus sp. MNP-M23]|uniref:flagellar motor switch protein FliN n=1 Tax=Acuticoccus sp. MNP-M23 TaxID=3072793 RepID=UPI00281514BF|nr:flagellar motor switch protein FliN [Acuticoccus sp. MNP-M23]WMS41801.1 flagellar motor switch protein FliN [Acuticoccus sp. MNP-M23]
MSQDDIQHTHDAAHEKGADAGRAKAAAFGGRSGGVDDGNVDSILRIPVVLQVVLGSATMPVSQLMKLGRGQVVALDHRVGEPVDIVVNGRVIARGEVVVVDDDSSRFGVSLTEIVGPGASAEA